MVTNLNKFVLSINTHRWSKLLSYYTRCLMYLLFHNNKHFKSAKVYFVKIMKA